MSYPEALEFLFNLQSHGIRPGLERMNTMTMRLESPQDAFSSVLVAGTNGKGSTSAMVAQGLVEGGFRVGLYTSPHLIDFRERIRIGDTPITERELVDLTDEIREAIAPLGPSFRVTFFEFTTAVAFLFFARRQVDLVVAEVGLGGRFDATNVLRPRVSVITPIDFDHEGYLGDTIESISWEKAGIIKTKVPVVVGRQRPDALRVIEEEAAQKGSTPAVLGSDFEAIGENPAGFLYQGSELLPLSCPLLGRHQVDNAALAAAALFSLQGTGLALPSAAIARGLQNVRWPGRLEVVREEPLVLLDGAHNPAGARALAVVLGDIKRRRGGRLSLVMGIMRDKKIPAIFQALLPIADELTLTRPDLARAASLSELSEGVSRFPGPMFLQERIPEALEGALSRLYAPDILCVCGSLYTVGEAKAYFSGAAVSPLRG